MHSIASSIQMILFRDLKKLRWGINARTGEGGKPTPWAKRDRLDVRLAASLFFRRFRIQTSNFHSTPASLGVEKRIFPP
ncbi:hypothetical protein CEXT_723431 [Caerostris extrusa]|uniref:Uncharacterized protein n=1 Tax=Caerostris extrusa TaxID=172846 RepID=A0AAV4UV00_CAEEX|nr:hypothetical protein CEXT_723431 [Caerostris extrusa]